MPSGRPVAAVALGDLVAEHRADGAVDVADRQLEPAPGWPSSSAGAARCDELRCRAPGRGRGPGAWCSSRSCGHGDSGLCRIGVRSSPLAFQWSTAARASRHSTWPMASASVRKPSAARSSRTSSAMNSKKFSTNSGLPVKRLPQLGVLRGHADRAGVEVADPHHDAARHDERRGGEAELLGAEQRGDDHVAAGLHLAVGLHDDAVAQAVEQQRLLRLGEAELPRRAGVLERRQRRRRRCRRRGRR